MEPSISNLPGGSLASTLRLKVFRLRSILKRYWWILFLAVAAGVGIESWIVYTKAELFNSSSDLMIREELVSDLSKQYYDYSGNLIGNALRMMQGPDVLEEAKRRVELQSPKLAGIASIVASVAPRTSIFTITGTGSNPEYTRLYVDAVVDEFIYQYRRLRSDTASESRDDMLRNRDKVRAQLAEAAAKRNEYKKANNMDFWVQQKDEANSHLSALRVRLTALTAEKNRLERLTPDQLLSTAPAALSASTNAPASGATVEAGASAEDPIFSSDLVSQYLQTSRQLNQQQANIDEKARIWKPKHPKMVDLQVQLSRLHRDLDNFRTEAVTLVKARIAAVNVWIETTQDDVTVWTDKAKAANEKSSEFSVLEEVVTDLRGRETKLNDAIGNLDIRSDTNILKVLRKASVASPVDKGVTKHILMGVIGGLVAGGLILFLLNRTDDRMSSSSELLEHFVEPILGQIPDVADSRTMQGLPLLRTEDDRYTYAEAYRSLRSSLIFMPNQADLKALLVTSAIPNEGKSTIASNLAVTMANAGGKVLLIDADLRRGDIAQLFDIDGRQGLSNVLRGELPWREAVVDAPIPNLHVIPRGPVTNQSSELLLKAELQTILAEMKSSYDLVIFNTSPILATDDTPTVAPHFDGVLMVVRAQFTSARLTQNALNTLYQRQVNVLGLILNCVDTDTPDYYYYRYPKYYAA
jgi:capsular exopolysaccharide synthesis family protein